MLASFLGCFSMRQALYQKVNVMDIERIRESFSYDESVFGCLVNKIDRGRAKSGEPTKVILDSVGYLTVGLDGKRFQAHRVIYALHHGEIPNGMVIDHIDGAKINNKISNLRCVTRSQNQQNRRKGRGGYWRNMKGISQVRPGYFRASIAVNGKSYSKSSYDLGECEVWLVGMRKKLHSQCYRHN
ncbi:hypothetical protein BZH87_23035 [Salmonella enterica]|nr:hypothetical protein [Salmonella enterica]EBA2181161.1 hypothetical protein [Salmonella enterica]EBA6490010.1 hypothetical protein [Salmonella enterica]EBE8492236.1 hypothetical protein [Salmonella enterica]EBP2593471.1 hypothetical protein [Salmonella enterica]